MNRIGRSLTIRIAGPLTILIMAFGSLLFYLVYITISGFVQNEIKRDLEGLAHRGYNICDQNFDDMLHSGQVDNPETLIITQALTLGQFEDYFRQENLQGIVYERKTHEVLLQTTSLPDSVDHIIVSGDNHEHVISIQTKGDDYFAYHFDFSPWNWHVAIIKSKKEFSGLISQVQKVYLYTFGLLVVTALLVALFLYQSISRPIGAIVKPIRKGKRPRYKGIDAFEFLSDTISDMMDSLRENEEKYRSLVETTSDFVWEVDINGTFIYASPMIKDLLGYSPDEVIGRPFFDLVPSDMQDKIKRIFFDAAASGQQILGKENVYLQKNGDHVVVETSGVPIVDGSGNLTGYRGISRDITERKRVASEQLSLERRIQQVEKAESLSRMAGAVAHHFNNILAATIGNLELALEELPQGTEMSESLADALKSVWRAVEMSNLMLTFLGQSVGNPKSHDLSENCERHITQLKISIHKNVQIETDLPRPGPVIKADPTQIRHLLSALIINAEEAIGKLTGKISISIKSLPFDEIPSDGFRVPAGWKPSSPFYACLTVSDTGCGIKDDNMGRIFDPFYTDKFVGRGLGLAVVLGTVKAYNGGIIVESVYGSGAVFRIFLPVSDEPIPLPKEAVIQPVSLSEREGGLVLLVEDQEILLSMATAMLERFGFHVLTARDGVEAIKIFRSHQTEILLVISDMSMPRMNGRELMKALRSLRADIPVILSSGYDEEEIMATDDMVQPQAFLHKPYQLATLKRVIDKVLSGNRPE